MREGQYGEQGLKLSKKVSHKICQRVPDPMPTNNTMGGGGGGGLVKN